MRATDPYLEHKLISINPRPGYLRDKTLVDPPAEPLKAPVEGFGDLVVLINPAVEAAAYQRLHALSRMNFAPAQWPLMLTISATNDGPRKTWFSAGRVAGEIFGGKPGKEAREDTLERRALGFATEQVTHELKPVNPDEKLRKQALAQQADVTFVGIGDLGPEAPLVVDGFISTAELKLLQKAGAVGEIVGWAFDAQGKFVDGLTNDRVASAPLPSRENSTVVATAVGEKKVPGIRAALNRRLVNGLITDEATAEAILAAG